MSSKVIAERIISAFHGKTQKEIESCLGIRYGIITDWKLGRSSPEHTVLAKVAEVTGCGMDWLLTGQTISEKLSALQEDRIKSYQALQNVMNRILIIQERVERHPVFFKEWRTILEAFLGMTSTFFQETDAPVSDGHPFEVEDTAG